MTTELTREERLQKIIARAGVASRRAAEQMIVEGRVQVDGRVIKELGAKADPSQSDIRVDGMRIRCERPRRYLVLNKPSGYLTTRSDPRGRPTVMDLLPPSLHSLYPVGRLDMSSTGLLLLTDDGEFAQRVGHPRFGIEKTYLVTVRGIPSDRTLERARNGIRVEGQRLKVKSVQLLGSRPQSKRIPHQSSPVPRRNSGSGVAYWRSGPKRERDKVETSRLDVVLVEGKNREVRRLFKALGHPVLELHRSRVGELSDRGLPEGMFRPLSVVEIRHLRSPTSARTSRDRRNVSYGGDSPRARRDHRSESYGAGPAAAKASASAKTSVDKPARSRRPPSHKLRRVSPNPFGKSDRRPKGEGGSSKSRGGPASAKTPKDKPARRRRSGGKGDKRASSKIPKRPGRPVKKGARNAT